MQPDIAHNTATGDVLAEIERLIAALESHPDPTVGERLRELLAGIDAVHRTALTHLVDAIHGLAGDAFMNRLTADPAVRLLLMAYDLVAVDRRILAEEALDLVRGRLHVNGVDIELREVAGGVVYIRLHGLERSGLDAAAVQREIEEVLARELIGFQQLEVQDRAAPGGFVPAETLRRARAPVYQAVATLAEVPPGAIKAVAVDDTAILLANVQGEIYAVQNRCGDGPLPLEFGSLEGAVLRCSWHGCRYDVRSGQRVDRTDLADRLQVYPVAVHGDEIRVATGTHDGAREGSRLRANDDHTS